jgi:hypothetical protein
LYRTSFETLPHPLDHLLGSHGAVRAPPKNLRFTLRCFRVRNISIYFLPFLCSFKIKTRVTSITAVLKLIIIFLRETFFEMCELEKTLSLIFIFFTLKKKDVNTVHPVLQFKKKRYCLILRSHENS